MKTYSVSTNYGSWRAIHGENLLDAITKSIKTLIKDFDLYETILPYKIVGCHKNGILGGKGGYEIIIDDTCETHCIWIADNNGKDEASFDVTFDRHTMDIKSNI